MTFLLILLWLIFIMATLKLLQILVARVCIWYVNRRAGGPILGFNGYFTISVIVLLVIMAVTYYAATTLR